MALQAVVRKSILATQADGESDAKLTLDAFGALSVQDPVIALLKAGALYFYNRGNTTTPVTFTNTAILYTRPSLVIRVPTGKTIFPVYLAVHFETQAGVINEAVWIACSNDVGAGTSTAVLAGTNRGNMRKDLASNAGGCLIQITYTGDVTTTGTDPVEFSRFNNPFADVAAAPRDHLWDIKSASNIPLLIGPASLIYIAGGGTALTGFMTTIWAEFNSADLGF